MGGGDGLPHVGGVEAAGQDDFQRRGARGFRPVEGAAGSAVRLAGGGVEEDGFGRVWIKIVQAEVFVDSCGSPDAESGGVADFISMQLDDVESQAMRQLDDALRGFVHEDADLPKRAWQLRYQLGAALGVQ